MAEQSIFDVMDSADRAKLTAEILYLVARLPLGISVLVGIVSYVLRIDASLRYFELVAQIIPVLLLALVIEQRYFFQEFPSSVPESPTGPTQHQWDRMRVRIYQSQAGVFLVLAGGEVAALWSVGGLDATRLTFAAATAGLVAGALAVVASSVKALVTSLGEKEISRINENLKGRFEKERDDRLVAWKKSIEIADAGISRDKRPEFEKLMEKGAELLRQIDNDLSEEHFDEELGRLTQKEKREALTPGEKMALRLMRRVESSADPEPPRPEDLRGSDP